MIATELKGTAVEAFWTGTSFLLTSTVFQPPFVTFTHAFGRRPMLISTLVLFSVGALMCGLATSFTLKLCDRANQCVGGGGIIAFSEILVTDLVLLRE
jgi:predicted MFS family arabinose efflux permease